MFCRLGDVLTRQVREVIERDDLRSIPIIEKITFGGVISVTDPDVREDYRGRLFWAKVGDLIYSKIRAKQGSLGIVPEALGGIAVSAEYPVYRPVENKIVPQYLTLLLKCSSFLRFLDGIASGGDTKTRIAPELFESLHIALPPLATQQVIVAYWLRTQDALNTATAQYAEVSRELDEWLHAQTNPKAFDGNCLTVGWAGLENWTVQSARAAVFKATNPLFTPFGTYAEDSTAMVKPNAEPEHDWPVYGVNNKDGVFFSHHQKGAEFNSPYKRIQKDWFFHNPTRSAVGSLGHVLEVPEDAITSPEYQVWKLRDLGDDSLLPAFVATLIQTKWFVKVIQFHRVGTVKQRLYVENLLAMPVPAFPREIQARVTAARARIAAARAAAAQRAADTAREVEAMILGQRPAHGLARIE